MKAGVGWAGALALVCAVLLGACRDPAKASGTALYVTTQFDPSLLLTQLRVWGTVDGGRPFGPQVLPEDATRLLQSGETLRILLEDAPDGAQATVYAEGLNNLTTVARGESTVRVRTGYEVDVALRLEPTQGGTPDGGSFCLDCEGCCVEGSCTTSSFNTCGSGGVACTACDPVRTNACDARGVCVCGTGPACAGLNVDRCVGGQCKCGGGSPCGPGQECVNGSCQCTPSSCATGCCDGNTCEPGTDRRKCGTGGAACRRCDNRCTAQRTCG